VKITVTDWLNGPAANFCDEGIVKLVQMPELQWALRRKINILYLIVTYDKMVLTLKVTLIIL
jgi:hypothetical protein